LELLIVADAFTNLSFLWAGIDFRLPTLTNYVHGKMVNVVVDGEPATKLLVASL
jgi:hypothetical protein